MSTRYCADCGGALTTQPHRCAPRPEAAKPNRRVRTWVGAVALVLFGALGGYLLGPGLGRVSRAREAVSDVALPVTAEMDRRTGGEMLRAELQRFVMIQEQFFREHGRYRNYGEVAIDAPFEINYMDGRSGASWYADMHLRGRYEDWCAVAVGKVPAYSMGIVLKQSAQVRCSQDLSTRLNRIIRQIVPVRFSS